MLLSKVTDLGRGGANYKSYNSTKHSAIERMLSICNIPLIYNF